ncbi:MAG: hypothetical protein MJE77_04075, partial [Proteobacteria bacterium]|nr:hypothetical protein [Pseudomonadota bacterium]
KILPKWAYDAVQKVLFRQANYVPRRPAKARGTGENESEHLRLVAYRSKQHHNKRRPERSSDAGELRPFSIAFCNPLKRDNQGNSSWREARCDWGEFTDRFRIRLEFLGGSCEPMWCPGHSTLTDDWHPYDNSA